MIHIKNENELKKHTQEIVNLIPEENHDRINNILMEIEIELSFEQQEFLKADPSATIDDDFQGIGQKRILQIIHYVIKNTKAEDYPQRINPYTELMKSPNNETIPHSTHIQHQGEELRQ